jgi:hypothetical protein
VTVLCALAGMASKINYGGSKNSTRAASASRINDAFLQRVAGSFRAICCLAQGFPSRA